MDNRRPRKILKSPIAKRRSRVIPKDQKVLTLLIVRIYGHEFISVMVSGHQNENTQHLNRLLKIRIFFS